MIVIDASSWMSMGAKQGRTISRRQKVKKVKTAEISAIHHTLRIANHWQHVLRKTVTCNVAFDDTFNCLALQLSGAKMWSGDILGANQKEGKPQPASFCIKGLNKCSRRAPKETKKGQINFCNDRKHRTSHGKIEAVGTTIKQHVEAKKLAIGTAKKYLVKYYQKRRGGPHTPKFVRNRFLFLTAPLLCMFFHVCAVQYSCQGWKQGGLGSWSSFFIWSLMKMKKMKRWGWSDLQNNELTWHAGCCYTVFYNKFYILCSAFYTVHSALHCTIPGSDVDCCTFLAMLIRSQFHWSMLANCLMMAGLDAVQCKWCTV